jgi:hypothetical protein
MLPIFNLSASTLYLYVSVSTLQVLNDLSLDINVIILNGGRLPPAAAPPPHMGEQTIREYAASKIMNGIERV